MIVLRYILTLMSLLDVAWWWTADRRLRPLGRRGVPWRFLVAAWALLMMSLLMMRFLPAHLSRPIVQAVPMPIVAAQYLWHLGILPVTLLFPLLSRGVRSIGGSLKRIAKPAPVPSAAPPAIHLSRRQILASAAAIALPPGIATVGAVGAVKQFGHYRVRQMTLRLPTLPPELDGTTIAHLSDFHVGRFVTPAMVRNVVDTTNELKPDLVLITGDLIDYALSDLRPALDELQRLKPSIGLYRGVTMCVGNHDLFESAPDFVRTVRNAGFALPLNSVRTIQVRDHLMQLASIDWDHGTEALSADVRFTATGIDPNIAAGGFPILLAHHPHAFDQAAALNIPLTLSGHTHGGQVNLTPNIGFGPLAFRYWSGLYQKPNGSQLVVSNGIGNWFPLRINAPAEIIRLTLKRA